MGYNLGGKAGALGLLAITNGDVEKAQEIWALIAYSDPMTMDEALVLVDDAVRKVLGSSETD